MYCASKEFYIAIYRYTAHKFRYNDSSRGVIVNYLARLVSGSVSFKGEGFEEKFEAGDIFFIPKGCKYISVWSGDKIVWDSFEFGFLPERADYPIQKLTADGEIYSLFDRIAATESITSETIALFYTLFAKVRPLLLENENESDSLIERAVEFIASHRNVSVPEIAKHCNVSVSSLYLAFRKAGKTPIGLKLELQLEHAVALLKTTDLKVDHIAERCGFNSVSYFNRVLKKATGKSPSEFRINGI